MSNGKYLNPAIDEYATEKENPLVLLAEVCNNIGKELTFSPSTKQQKSNSSFQRKSLLKRSASPIDSNSSSTKKQSTCQPSLFDSLVSQQFNSNLSLFSSYPWNSPSLFSTPFIYNWAHSYELSANRHLLDQSSFKPFYYP